MTDNTTDTTATSIETLSEPGTLTDVDDVPYERKTREFDDRMFERLRERHEAIDGLVQVAVTTSDGRLLLQGWDGPRAWAPPGFSVGGGQDWVVAANNGIRKLTGADITLNGVLLVDDLTFRHAETGETISTYGVSFGASLVDEDGEFAENPTPDQSNPRVDENMALEWFTEMPDNVDEEHADHIELFLDYARSE